MAENHNITIELNGEKKEIESSLTGQELFADDPQVIAVRSTTFLVIFTLH